jgi:hypothetical protein
MKALEMKTLDRKFTRSELKMIDISLCRLAEDLTKENVNFINTQDGKKWLEVQQYFVSEIYK